jgi:hypothetical protein
VSSGVSARKRTGREHVVVEQEDKFTFSGCDTPLQCDELPALRSAEVGKSTVEITQFGEGTQRFEIVEPIDHDDQLKSSRIRQDGGDQRLKETGAVPSGDDHGNGLKLFVGRVRSALLGTLHAPPIGLINVLCHESSG